LWTTVLEKFNGWLLQIHPEMPGEENGAALADQH